MNDFIHFSEVCPERKETWASRRILSVDIDWASDDVLNDTIDLIESFHVKACFFVTHRTVLLEKIRANPLFEVGLHPNFDPLLLGRGSTSAKHIIADLAEFVPGARILRSHAMTTSGRWLDLYKDFGITHLSNYLMFGDSLIHPFRQLNGLIESPVYFADDGMLYQRQNSIASLDIRDGFGACGNGLQVFNFHPIHLFINTDDLQKYSLARIAGDDASRLRSLRHPGDGARAWLANLLS